MVEDIKKYLQPFDNEEGGLLFGRNNLIELFYPIKNSFYQYKDFFPKNFEIPPESIGYFPDPTECAKIRIEMYKNNYLEKGYVHGHVNAIAKPSSYDIINLPKEKNYLMAIHSKTDNKINVYKLNEINLKGDIWTYTKLFYSDVVELVATL